ncbi:MAG: thiamine pyrophosphate-dependent enzyme [Acidobacteriota bacterium]|nr:thiamine pyrophosphate-dependent enzyme [Acidobacteriota bacterium]
MDAATKRSRATRAKTSEQEPTQDLENTTKKARRKTSQKKEEQAVETNSSTPITTPQAQDQPDGDATKTPKNEFGAWLRQQRETRGLTQARAAQAVGIHVNQLARIEKGESGTKKATVSAIAKAFSLDETEALQRAGFIAPSVEPTSNGTTAKTNGRGVRTARGRKQPQPVQQPDNRLEQQETKPQLEETGTNSFLDRETMIGIYRTMYLARKIDDKEIQLKNQNKVFFQINGVGHEALLVGAGLAFKPEYDWFYPYYRDRALMLQIGMTPYEMFLSSVGAEADPNSHGRQMPSHWGHVKLNVPSTSSPTGTQALQAVGAAEASYRASLVDELKDKVTGFKGDEVVWMSVGDGTTSEGEWWEALNTASNLKLPVVFVVEDNGYAISVPVEVNTPGGDISKVVSGFPNLYIQKCDGTDPLESYETFKRAVQYCRERKGPAFVHGKVIRPYSHSLSDDEKLYRPEEERNEEAQRDPIKTFGELLMENGFASSEELQALREGVEREVNEAADQALAMPQPAPESALRNIYSEEIDPTDRSVFDNEEGAELSGNAGTMVDLINRCLHEEMARDERIVVFGEDVADVSREEYIEQVKGKGGVFKVTANLQRKFGSARVFNSPLAEANIVGRAIGMATRGLKPVVEIQFFDYIFPAYHQIRNELATMRWRSDGDWKCPVVMRVPVGGYLKGGAIYHSQSGTTIFSHTPGIRIVYPSNALDANGLLRTAIRCDDPVLFLEHKHLYRQAYNKSQYPPDGFLIPFGKAKTVRPGKDLTIITYGALVQRSFVAAKKVAQEHGIETEIIDLRSLVPYDWEAIAESVKRTNRVIVAHEDSLSWGYGAEIAARISEELFEYLDAPVKRIGATDTFVAYAPQVEDFILPQAENVEQAILELSRY